MFLELRFDAAQWVQHEINMLGLGLVLMYVCVCVICFASTKQHNYVGLLHISDI